VVDSEFVRQAVVTLPAADPRGVHVARRGVSRDFRPLGAAEIGTPLRSVDIAHRRYPASDFVVDPEFFRPVEVDVLCGNPTKARERLNWSAKQSLEYLVCSMVDSDLRLV
jgi:GDP-D-mannose dehydratase